MKHGTVQYSSQGSETNVAMTAIQQQPAVKPPPLGYTKEHPCSGSRMDASYVERLMPDPYLFAVILTLLVVGLIFLLVPNANAGGIVDSWYQGVWGTNNIFTFAMQMVLILVSGYTLAEAPVIKRGLGWLASPFGSESAGSEGRDQASVCQSGSELWACDELTQLASGVRYLSTWLVAP
jgi:hypothetical protein